ncbi:hypothetical protein ACFLW0_03960, partial [Chloroflexota bacterium]
IYGFYYPGSQWHHILVSIALAIAFAAIWLTGYWTPVLKKPWAWAVLAGSAFLSWMVVAFIQIPLQYWSNQAIEYIWGQRIYMQYLLLAGIPGILVSGLVQEGSKLVPVVIYWWRSGRNISPGLGLALGAVAGAGLGIFEATWLHNVILSSGWDSTSLMGFAERFFSIALHIGLSAIAGYGLAKGWGWQSYLIVALIHAVNNYGSLLLQAGLLSLGGVEIYFAVVALLVTASALWIRWKILADTAENTIQYE